MDHGHNGLLAYELREVAVEDEFRCRIGHFLLMGLCLCYVLNNGECLSSNLALCAF